MVYGVHWLSFWEARIWVPTRHEVPTQPALNENPGCLSLRSFPGWWHLTYAWPSLLPGELSAHCMTPLERLCSLQMVFPRLHSSHLLFCWFYFRFFHCNKPWSQVWLHVESSESSKRITELGSGLQQSFNTSTNCIKT